MKRDVQLTSKEFQDTKVVMNQNGYLVVDKVIYDYCFARRVISARGLLEQLQASSTGLGTILGKFGMKPAQYRDTVLSAISGHVEDKLIEEFCEP